MSDMKSTTETEQSKAVQAQVRSFVEKNFYVPDSFALGDDTSLLESGIVDSTGVMEIVSYLQSDFGIDVPDRDLIPDNLDSITKIGAYIRRMSAGGSSQA